MEVLEILLEEEQVVQLEELEELEELVLDHLEDQEEQEEAAQVSNATGVGALDTSKGHALARIHQPDANVMHAAARAILAENARRRAKGKAAVV